MMNNNQLVEFCKSRLGQGYIYGAYFDRIITESYIQAKAAQYPQLYTASYMQRSRKWLGQYAGEMTIGAATTLDPGESATVTNIGTSTDAVLDIGIPAGYDGSAVPIDDASTAADPVIKEPILKG